MQLVRSGPAGSAALELAVSHALLTRVAAGELPRRCGSTVPRRRSRSASSTRCAPATPRRSKRPAPTATSRSCACPAATPPPTTAQSLAIDVVWALEDPVVGTHDALRRGGRAARGRAAHPRRRRPRGRGPGRVLPGRVQRQRPRPGEADRHRPAPRPRRGPARAPRSSSATAPASAPCSTTSTRRSSSPGTPPPRARSTKRSRACTLDAVEAAVLAAYGPLEPATLDEPTLALAHRLAPQRAP